MNQLAVIDDLAARRSAAARKAVETRRARAALHQTGVSLHERAPSLHSAFHGAVARRALISTPEMALAAFDREAASDTPDWHRAAIELRRALTARPQTLTQKVTRSVAIAAPVWPDYPVDHLGSFKIRNPTIVVTFANGEIVRAPAVSARDKPVNIGRGLRIAIAFCQARLCRRMGLSMLSPKRRRPAIPAIVACICEDTGEIYDAKQCTMRTIESRKGRGRNRHDRRRIKTASPRSE